MKILYILRLLSGNPANSASSLITLLMAEFKSILQTRTLNLGKCFMTIFMTSKQPTKASYFPLIAKREKPRAWYIARDLPASEAHSRAALKCPATCRLLPLDVLWLLCEGPVSSFSPHLQGLHGLFGKEQVSENHTLLDFSAKF